MSKRKEETDREESKRGGVRLRERKRKTENRNAKHGRKVWPNKQRYMVVSYLWPCRLMKANTA